MRASAGSLYVTAARRPSLPGHGLRGHRSISGHPLAVISGHPLASSVPAKHPVRTWKNLSKTETQAIADNLVQAASGTLPPALPNDMPDCGEGASAPDRADTIEPRNCPTAGDCVVRPFQAGALSASNSSIMPAITSRPWFQKAGSLASSPNGASSSLWR